MQEKKGVGREGELYDDIILMAVMIMDKEDKDGDYKSHLFTPKTLLSSV